MTRIRIKKVKSFSSVFNRSRRFQAKNHFSHVGLNPLGAPGECQFAVVSSKKAVSKRAVDRNRAKRRYRALMRDVGQEWFDSQGFKGSLNWIVRAKHSCLTAPAHQLKNELQQALNDLCKQEIKRHGS